MEWARQINIKTPAEIAIMREAGRINALALSAVRELLQPGITTAELNSIAEDVLQEHGAYSPFKNYGSPPFPASITVSINEQLVHGIPGKRKLVEGDIVSIDCGAVFEGFIGDSAFTAGVGEISNTAKKIIDVTEKALYEGIKEMLAGNRTGDVSSAIQRFVERHGFHVTREYTGHGVGRQMHEGPQVPNYGMPRTGILLQPGMTIALEPMVIGGTHKTRILPDHWTVISVDGSLTAHYEHTVAITDGGPLILTALDTKEKLDGKE